MRRASSLLLFLLLFLMASCRPEIDPSVTAFVGVNVLPMDSERILPDHTVLVRDDRIAEIGPADEVEIPPEANRINCDGHYLLPGFTDMHVHVWNEDHLLLLVANGVTTVRNMWGAPLHLGWRQQIKEGDLLSPFIYTTGALTDGARPVWRSSRVAKTAEKAREMVVADKAAGYDFIKVYGGLKREVYEAIVDEAAQQNIRVVGHVPRDVGLSQVLSSRQSSIEHLDGLWDALLRDDSAIGPAWSQLPRAERLEKLAQVAGRIERGELGFDDVFSEERLRELAVQIREADVWNVPTLVVNQIVPPEEVADVMSLPYMKYVDPETRQRWDTRQNPFFRDIASEVIRANRVWNGARAQWVRALHRAGARILLGTDTPNPFVVPGFAIHEELDNLVRAGLTPYEAIRAGTHDAAEYLLAFDEFGTVSAGKRADLFLVSGNPLESVDSLSDPIGVMLRGRWLPKDELQSRLDELVVKYVRQEEARGMLFEGDVYAFVKTYEASEPRLFSETDLNRLGYALLGAQKVDDAIEIFLLATREHPESGNVWDSLAEGYMIRGDVELAIENYEKCLEVDPTNKNAVEKLEELRSQLSS